MPDPRQDIDLAKTYIKTYRVQTSATVTEYTPVALGTLAGEVLDATSGATAIGIALQSGTAGDYVSVAMLSSQCPIPVKVGVAGATLDTFLEIGTTGAVSRTLGGGTVVRHIIGKALETGVSGDIIAMLPAVFDGVRGVDASGSVVVIPSGVDDTDTICDALQAGLDVRLVYTGQPFLWDGRRASTTLTAARCGRIICDDGVVVNPVDAWVPATDTGTSEDVGNSFLQVAGQVVAGGVVMTTATKQQRGATALVGLSSTVGVEAGMFFEVVPTTGQASAFVSKTIVEIASVYDATTLVLRRPLDMQMGPNESGGPFTLTQITPVREFAIIGGEWSTLGRNVGGLVAFSLCYADPTVPMALSMRGLSAGGFSRAVTHHRNTNGYVEDGCYSLGTNNCWCLREAAHNFIVTNWRSNPDGEIVHPYGYVRMMFWDWQGTSDGVYDQCHGQNVTGMFHCNGGWNVSYGLNTVREANPSARWLRDPVVGYGGSIIACMYEGGTGPVATVEWAREINLGTMIATNCYHDNSFVPTQTIFPCAFSIHDTKGFTATLLVADNATIGASHASMAGTIKVPCAGVHLRDNYGGGPIGTIRARNCGVAGLEYDGANCGVTISEYNYDSTTDSDVESPNLVAIIAGSSGNNQGPKIKSWVNGNQGLLVTSTDFQASPDYEWLVDEFLPTGQTTSVMRGVRIVRDLGGTTWNEWEVAKIDTSSSDGTRALAVAAENDPGLVIVAMGAEQLGSHPYKLIANGGRVKTTGDVHAGKHLIAAGGSGHAAKEDPGTATFATTLGVAQATVLGGGYAIVSKA